MRLTTASFSHPGGRKSLEDRLSLEATPDSVIGVACDGLGGMGHGARASEICAAAIVLALKQAAAHDDETRVFQAIRQGDAALKADQAEDRSLAGARSTAAAWTVRDGRLAWATVGDTRVYRFTSAGLADVSPDDSAGYAAFLRGEVGREQIRTWDGRSNLTACLGDEREVEPHTGTAELSPGDAILACTDGLWQYVYDLEMEVDLAKADSAGAWLDLLLLRLVQRSHLDGDNIAVAATYVKE